jgi:hypothetical protein
MRLLMNCRTPDATNHNHEPKAHCDDDRAREQQSFDTVLDRVENHEGKDEREEEQEHWAQQRMPQPSFDGLA